MVRRENEVWIWYVITRGNTHAHTSSHSSYCFWRSDGKVGTKRFGSETRTRARKRVPRLTVTGSVLQFLITVIGDWLSLTVKKTNIDAQHERSNTLDSCPPSPGPAPWPHHSYMNTARTPPYTRHQSDINSSCWNSLYVCTTSMSTNSSLLL